MVYRILRLTLFLKVIVCCNNSETKELQNTPGTRLNRDLIIMKRVFAGIAGATAGLLILPMLGQFHITGMEQWDIYLSGIFALLGTIVGLSAVH